MKNQKVILLVFTLLFVITPFYGQASLGGEGGFAITFNIPVWLVASWMLSAGFLVALRYKILIFPKVGIYLLAFPLILIVSSIVMRAGINQPITWLFRQLYILGGLFFLFALFQFKIKTDRILFIIAIASGMHALLGMMQIYAPELISTWFPTSADRIPRGMFRQINVHVSFLATGLMVSLYLISRPSFRHASMITRLLVVISFGLAFYIVITSGSRVGLLSMILGIPLVLLSRYRQLNHHKGLLIILLFVSCIGTLLGQLELTKTIDKSAQLVDKSYSTARVAMYTIGLELVVKEPVHGHGIGSFLKVWNPQASDFVNRYPETVLPNYVTHPHNELLLWTIEGGLAALAGIIIAILGVGLALYRCGFQRGGAYAAMLLPISLHTQVELPFYISSLHWFLWLFLIYLALRHETKTIIFNLSSAATSFMQSLTVIFAIGMLVFMVNTARAQADLYTFLYEPKKASTPYLQIALNNIYFKPLAEQIAMRSMLYANIENTSHTEVEAFEKWALQYVDESPELKMYEDLISASVFLRPEGNGCDAKRAALVMYAHNKALQKAVKDCL